MKIALAIAAYKGFVAVDHSASVTNLLLLAPPGVQWITDYSLNCGVLPRARNTLVARAMAQGCDAVLFLDDDIGFNPQDVYRMIATGCDVIGAIPQARNTRWNEPPRLAVTPHNMTVFLEQGVAIPSEPRLPMALTLIRSHVFKRILELGLAERYVYPKIGDEAQQYLANYFGYELAPCPEWSMENETAKRLGIENPKSDDGEDHYFCRRAAEAGFPCFIDINAELRHWEGNVCHDYSYRQFMVEHRTKLALERAPNPPRTIGVVLPTRGRPDRAKRSIASLMEKARHPERVKVFLGVDADDAVSVEAFPDAVICPRAKTVALMIDRLSAKAEAEADIVMRFDDDIVMCTQDWDVITDGSVTDWGIFHPDDSKQAGRDFCSLAVMSSAQAKWLRDEQGFVHAPWFPFWFTDTWLDEVGGMTGLKTELPIAVEPPEGKGKTHGLREIGFWAGLFNRGRGQRKDIARRLIETAYSDEDDKAKALRSLNGREVICEQKTRHLSAPEFIAQWETRGEAFDEIAEARYAEARSEAERLMAA